MESTTQKVHNSTSDVDNFSDVEKVKYSSVVIYTYYKYNLECGSSSGRHMR